MADAVLWMRRDANTPRLFLPEGCNGVAGLATTCCRHLGLPPAFVAGRAEVTPLHPEDAVVFAVNHGPAAAASTGRPCGAVWAQGTLAGSVYGASS